MAKAILSAVLLEKFLTVAGQLSPENLCCDGELRGRALQVKENRLRAEWKRLEKEAGRPVTESEVYKLWDSRIGAR